MHCIVNLCRICEDTVVVVSIVVPYLNRLVGGPQGRFKLAGHFD